MTEKFVTIREELHLNDYDSHYNHLPTEEMKEITESDFVELLLEESWDITESKQPKEGNKFLGKMKVFIKLYDEDTLGIAVLKSYPDKITYYKFGDWKKLNLARIQLFSGDRS